MHLEERVFRGTLRVLCAVCALSIVATQVASSPWDILSKLDDGADWITGIEFSGTSPKLVHESISGNALRLEKGQCVRLKTRDFGKKSGTISVWIRPQWNYYDAQGGSLRSHTLMSGKRVGGGYFVLSDGWWEKNGGSEFTYFVADNRDRAPLKHRIVYRKNEWTHLSVVWTERGRGQLSLYIDGKLAAERSGFGAKSSISDFYIGCDHGTSIRANRWAIADYDLLRISQRALSATEIATLWHDGYSVVENLRKTRKHIRQHSLTTTKHVTEKRVLFDEGPSQWQTPEKTDALIRKLVSAGINIYIPCVWHGDGTRYPSNVAPKAAYARPGDPLKYLISRAHENGIEVHPWFTITLRKKAFLRSFYDSYTPPDAFDVFNPNFRKFISDVVIEVVTNYDIDGVNLDYVRTMGGPRGPIKEKSYLSKYGRSLVADKQQYQGNGALEPHLQEFVDDAVEAIIMRISNATRTIRPDAVISVDGHPKPKVIAPSRQGRRERVWLEKGYIDEVYAMSYEERPDVDGFNLFVEESGLEGKVTMLVGAHNKHLKGYPSRTPQQLLNLVAVARSSKSNGVAIYPLSRLTHKHLDALGRGPFRDTQR